MRAATIPPAPDSAENVPDWSVKTPMRTASVALCAVASAGKAVIARATENKAGRRLRSLTSISLPSTDHRAGNLAQFAPQDLAVQGARQAVYEGDLPRIHVRRAAPLEVFLQVLRGLVGAQHRRRRHDKSHDDGGTLAFAVARGDASAFDDIG